mmetsp:Transcript_77906/g.252625  ORF Transcript_77906/g.252625 Transcript_77906/m.252625 type:complete len:248 (+) Transcript_77906:1112-1855(+)
MEDLPIVVNQRPMAMLQAIPPSAIKGVPLASIPCHRTPALTPVGDELPDVLHTVLPLHAALAGHRVLGEVALVDGAIRPLQDPFAIGLAAVELPLVLGAFWPRHLAVAGAHVVDVGAGEARAIEVHLRALALALVMLPLGIMHRALRVGQRPSSVPLAVPELTSVCGVVRVGDDNMAVPRTLLQRRERQHRLGRGLGGHAHAPAATTASAQARHLKVRAWGHDDPSLKEHRAGPGPAALPQAPRGGV